VTLVDPEPDRTSIGDGYQFDERILLGWSACTNVNCHSASRRIITRLIAFQSLALVLCAVN